MSGVWGCSRRCGSFRSPYLVNLPIPSSGKAKCSWFLAAFLWGSWIVALSCGEMSCLRFGWKGLPETKRADSGTQGQDHLHPLSSPASLIFNKGPQDLSSKTAYLSLPQSPHQRFQHQAGVMPLLATPAGAAASGSLRSQLDEEWGLAQGGAVTYFLLPRSTSWSPYFGEIVS